MRQYQQVTDRIIAMLEQGVRPWNQGWNAYAGGGRPLRHGGQGYRGANVLNLWAAAMSRGFASPYWLTYKKATELGAQVKKGAKSELAFFVGTIKRAEEKGGEDVERTIPFLKSYCVFNAEEVEALAPHYYRPIERTQLGEHERHAATDLFIANTGARIEFGGGRAYYRPSTDQICLPEFGAFDDASTYYGTTLHELTHWTGADKRLDRGKGNLFGTPEYAFEELIAELGAAFLCADLGVTAEPREDHAAYIQGWLKALRNDPRNIFRAASMAEKAAEFLHGFQSQAAMAA